MAKRILVIVEGEKKDYQLMVLLTKHFLPDEDVEIVPYGTNIHELYHTLFKDAELDKLDFLQLLKMREKDHDKKLLFDARYTDILLIFDYDPQDKLYSSENLEFLLQYFSESTENGRLYINYPMVEAFYHLETRDETQDIFNQRVATLQELRDRSYKKRVSQECFCNDFRKFTKDDLVFIISRNLGKVIYLLHKRDNRCNAKILSDIFTIETELLKNKGIIAVLNTASLFIYEYNSKFLPLDIRKGV